MNAVLGGVIAAIVGAVLAGVSSFGIVSSQTSTPSPIDKPYIVYGNN